MSFIGSTESPNQLDNEISVVDLVASHDWSSTPLGPMETWDSTLKSTVNLCLHSVFPIAIYYGPEFVSIYNQMWRPILKMKHPQALGKPFKEVWPETHHTTEPIFNEVMATRKGRFENDMLFVTDRDGYVEETYASFTLSPIFKEDGSMGGILNASQETTQRVLANRRLKALTELGNKTPGAKSVKDACHLITQTIRNNNADMPYALIYLIENHSATSNSPSTDTPKAHLVATTFDEDLDLQKVDGFDEISVAQDKLRRFLPDFLLDTEEIVDLENVSDEIDELIKSDGNIIKSTVCIKPGKSNALSSGLDNDPKFCTLFETGEKIITSPDFSSSWPLQYVARTNLHIIVTLKDYTHAVLFPVKNTTGDLTAIIIIGINKQRALDKEYMEFLHLVIGQVSASLSHGRFREEERKQAETLASLNDQKILFFQNISHELRTPLTLMLSPLEEVLEECPRDEPMYSQLCMIQRNTRRLLRLVNTLLQFSRIESDKIEANYHEVDIGQLTSELAANFESMAKLFKLEYRVEIPDNFDSRLEKKVFVDLEMYEKIIFNLCSNAFKHTWNGGITVRLDADRKDDKEVVVLEVSDTGVGISEEEIPNLFQRFYRIKSRQSRCHEGTGIGLALVKELTSLHGGDITCTSVLDRGTTFKICLPTGHEHLVSKRIFFRDDLNKGKGLLTLDRNNILFDNKQLYLDESLQWIQNNDREFEENENEQDTENDMNIDSDNGKIGDNYNDEYKELILESKEKYFPHTIEDPIPLINSKHVVLLVDDNADMRNYLIGLLQKEYTVYSAFDGRDALKLLKRLKCPPDLILSDILMPNMNGYELLKNIRNNNATQSIPVILLSAKAEEGDSIIGLDKGASDYLTKPFSARELMARVRVNIKLSYLRQQLFLHQYHQAETKQLLFSISNKIHSGYNLKETLSSAVEEIHNILPSDRLFVVANEQYEGGNDVIVAFSAKDKNEKNLEGNTVKYTSEQIKKQSDPALFGKGDIGKKGMLCSSCGGSKLDDHFSIANKTLSEIENENKFVEPGSQISAIENMVQHSDHKDLEIAIIPKFYSFIVQKHVSLLAVAIIVNNSIWGWIKAHRLPNHNWLDWEKEFLQQISNQISLAITHSKLSEEKLKKDAQMEAAKAANEAKGQILANTSHELRTPLGAIIGVLSALEETPLTEDQKDMIDIMSRASDVVLSVVNDILDAAKMEAQKIKLMNRAFNLFDLVEKTIELFGERAGTKQIELILDCEPNKLPKFVISDPERLQQVLVNLLSNSIKFTDNGQIVLKISISSNDDVIEESSDASAAFEAKGQEIKGKSKLLVEIFDTGIGIEPAFIKVIFDSFSQGDASMTRRHDGTGLGLSICKHLVSINGGELRVQSELGKGSKFWFTWNVDPIAMTATQISSMPQIPPSTTSSDEPTFPSMIRSKRVLVIDSVENARHSLVKLISASVDKVDAFDSCEEGINKARQIKSEQNGSPYDLVFLNVYLETADLVKRAALQLRSICGQDLSIAFLVFWSVKGRALGKVLINQIGGHAAALCKPVMQKKLFDCLYNNSLFKQQSDVSDTSEYDMREYNAIRSLVDIRTEKYYFNNRRINDKAPMTIEADENHHRSHGEDLNAMIIDQECVIKDQKVNLIEPQVSNITSTGKEANVVIGVKRNVSEKNDNNPRAQKSRSRAMSKSKCILCVEDNPINLKVIKHQLSKLGYPTLSATNGQEAINLVEAEYAKLPSDHNSSSLGSNLNDPPEPPLRISLILMDCAMPILSGFDASRAIRMMQPPASNIPIIALTASAVQGTRDKCLESGMNDFLTKPLRIPELKEMLNKWLGNDE